MREFPVGSRHVFDDYQILCDAFGWEEGSLERAHCLRVFELFNQKKLVLWRVLWEVDGLLDTDHQWVMFSHELIWMSMRYGSIVDSQVEIDRRKKASILRGKVIKTTVKLVKQINELRMYALDSESIVPRDYADFYPNNTSLFSLMGIAADCQNEFKEYFDNEPCTYRDDLEADMLELVYKTSGEARIDSLAFLLALLVKFSEEKTERHNDHFDPLAFSQKRGASDFIRAFTSSLKGSIKQDYLPERLKNLSFLSIDVLTGVLFPYGSTKACQCVDTDWNPIKDSADKKPKNPTPKDPAKHASK